MKQIHLSIFLALGMIFYSCTSTKSRKLLWLLVPAFIVAMTRPYLGLHYPSDIAGGIIIGTGMAWGFTILYKKFEQLIARRSRSEPRNDV